MRWPAVPDLIYSDRVKARAVTWNTKDKAGGRVPVPGAWSTEAYRCSITATSVDQAVTRGEQSIVTHHVTADSRLGNIRDQLLWMETEAILTIVGIEPAGDIDGRLWVHYTQEFLSQ